MPKAVGGIDMGKAVLEPTFFSEVLGIQGRLDLLVEKDGEAVIVEQKSGKERLCRQPRHIMIQTVQSHRRNIWCS